MVLRLHQRRMSGRTSSLCSSTARPFHIGCEAEKGKHLRRASAGGAKLADDPSKDPAGDLAWLPLMAAKA